jgi:hypothetical protein
MNYEVEIIKLLMDDAELRKDYPRICAVAHVVAKNEEDFLPYVWAYASGKSDWRKIEKEIS